MKIMQNFMIVANTGNNLVDEKYIIAPGIFGGIFFENISSAK